MNVIELQETYQKAIEDGRELHKKVVSFLIFEPNDSLIHELYEIDSGIFRRPPSYIDEIARLSTIDLRTTARN